MSPAQAPTSPQLPTCTATLLSSSRITPPGSPEDVRHLRFVTADAGFEGRVGQCVRVRAPGQFGQRHHERLYSLAGLEQDDPQNTVFELLVRRCSLVDDFSGERYPGVASNHLCDLPPGGHIEFTGPVGHPFDIPTDVGAPLLMIGMGTGIAPFRGLVQRIYDRVGGWQGPVRLFYGARTGLELLYMNNENDDLANYYDQRSFKAFQALSPKPHFGDAPALDRSLADNATEVLEMLRDDRTRVFIAGPQAMLPGIDKVLAQLTGADDWAVLRERLVALGRWSEVLY